MKSRNFPKPLKQKPKAMSIASEIQQIKASLPEGVQLVAISKYHPKEAIEEAYAAGQRIFGESKVQEMTEKYEALPRDIQWHFIGHLQTNKIKYMAPYVALIHGVDSLKLLTEIDKQAAKAGRIIPCLLQIHVAQEETKFGFSFEECRQMLAEGEWRALTHVRIDGVMGMASNVDDEVQIRREFHSLRTFFEELRQGCFASEAHFKEVSMGMSHDYPIALDEGATLVRIGSKIFGERIYI
jgi:pyridoxal phosphate enzyme (YggS family)